MTSLVLPGRFRAAVFDCDGLLADTEPVWAAAEAELLARHGQVFTEEDAAATVGRAPDASIPIYGRRIGLSDAELPALYDELLGLFRERSADVRSMPGARELVSALHGRIPLGVASGSPRIVVAALLHATGLADAFDVVVTAEDVTAHKPAPDAYLLACERLGVDPFEAIAFEDSGPGVRSAAAAGLFCVAVPTPGADTSAADLVLPTLEAATVSPR